MEQPLTRCFKAGGVPPTLAEYQAQGGYQAVEMTLGKLSTDDLKQKLRESGLRGRGGAGFLTGVKSGFVASGPGTPVQKYLVANADEMEPGTNKDRFLLEGNPHQFLEGMVLTAYAIGATQAFVFLRWAYKLAAKRILQAIQEMHQAGYLGQDILQSGYSLDIKLHPSAGRYICGEETALLNALEGRRAIPRAKPPFPPMFGLWGKPTIVQNVETLCNVPPIVVNGPAWYQDLGRAAEGGTKIFGVSGKIKRPGLWELPMGTSMRELLFEHAGGMRNDHSFVALLPGGASTSFLGPEHLDLPMDFDSIQQAGSRLGTGTMIVLDDKTCPVGYIANLMHFFAQESCGFCTPCRDGLAWVNQTTKSIENGQGQPEDLEILSEHCHFLGPGFTHCALAPGAMAPLESGLQRFAHEFKRHIDEKRCAWR